jgi:hypothetical protein
VNPEDLERRCPRLGSSVCFDYCRVCGHERQPCFKVFDCWWELFDVVAYFRQHLSPEAFEHLRHAKPPDQVATRVDLIQIARERSK